MTLNELIRKAQALSMQLSSGDVPLVTANNTLVEDITLEFRDEEDAGQYVDINIW